NDGEFNARTIVLLTQPLTIATLFPCTTLFRSPSVYGQSVTFTATVTATAPGAGTPTGTATFKDGLTTIGTGTLAGGSATFSTATHRKSRRLNSSHDSNA